MEGMMTDPVIYHPNWILETAFSSTSAMASSCSAWVRTMLVRDIIKTQIATYRKLPIYRQVNSNINSVIFG